MTDQNDSMRLSRRTFGALAAGGLASLAAPHVARAQARPRLVIVGGGFGGASAANFARRTFPQVDVTIIEPYKTFVTCPYGNLVLGGLRQVGQITHSYDGLRKRGVNVVHDTVTGISDERRNVRLASGAVLPFDRLIVSPGIALRWNAIQGYDEKASEIFPHAWQGGDGSQIALLRRQLEAMPDGGVFAIAIPDNPFRCPPGPYERISMIAAYLKQHKPRAKILALDSKDTFSKQGLFQDGWKELYGDMIEWVPAKSDGKVVRVDVKEKVLETEFGTKHKVDVANIVPPQSAGRIAIESGLAAENGWVPIDAATFKAQKAQHIHVIGDASIAPPMPKSGYVANSTAKQAVAAAVAAIEGKEAPAGAVYYNTCYSHLAADYGISVVGIYRVGEKGFVEVPGAGGLSPRGPLAQHAQQRQLEAQYATSWYESITQDMFG